jgi:hypothetical protein
VVNALIVIVSLCLADIKSMRLFISNIKRKLDCSEARDSDSHFVVYQVKCFKKTMK